MKKTFVILFAALMALPALSWADEGMWLVNLFESSIYPQMKKQGLKLDAKEIYNENTPGVSSAVVMLDGGSCSGSMISSQGLMITNHHCAYGDIHAMSTPEHNYLESGFWAKNQAEEKVVPGKTIAFLRKVIDVTDEALAMRAEIARTTGIGIFTNRRIYGNLEQKYSENTPYEAACASMWRGQKYFLFLYEVYEDVRLVGAPPVAIGAFGGEQDNWSWPQHKGDFAIYRVYGDKDGKPAAYSSNNKPITPSRTLNISTKGVKEGDYTMIMGFPGRTNRYVSSFKINEKQHVVNPIVIKSRRDKLDIYKAHMEKDPDIRLKYADTYFGISNYADFTKWENICFRRYNVAAIRAQEEIELQKWIEADPARQEKYGTLLVDMKRGYDSQKEPQTNITYFRENWFGISPYITGASRMNTVSFRAMKAGEKSIKPNNKDLLNEIKQLEENTKILDLATEKETITKLGQGFIDNVPQSMWGQDLIDLCKKFNNDMKAIVNYAFENSFYPNVDQCKKFFSVERSLEEITADPLCKLASSIEWKTFLSKEEEAQILSNTEPEKLEAKYIAALYQMRKDKGIPQYPDANSTMRLTYGTVQHIDPYDGVTYGFQSTINGYLEKYNPEDYEFHVDDKMMGLIKSKDWGRWGEKGQLYVNFLTNNDITGGNSGSPVMNANGELIGLAFDGNRESMSGDAYYHPEYFKTVCVDIRFVMWVIEKYADGTYLTNEMKFVSK